LSDSLGSGVSTSSSSSEAVGDGDAVLLGEGLGLMLGAMDVHGDRLQWIAG